MGGQTALNTALDLHSKGILKKHGIEMIGATKEAIDKAKTEIYLLLRWKKNLGFKGLLKLR
ncbi:MAG: hypothetical protein Ct9H90mP4_10640 [Gammaproteobacteria bacterium]|nr:MAG: hypothetical protein Ct9H90mP4_10640 [Gammaproteobacteria bacterium]